MLRPQKSNGTGKRSPQQQQLLPVTAGTTPLPDIHHYHRRRKRLTGGDFETTSTSTMIKLVALVLVSVLLVFGVATHSSTRNLDQQQQATFRQEEHAIHNRYQQHHQQHRRSMTEADVIQAFDTEAADVADDDTVDAYDMVVIGAGPAGLTAALFGARAGLSVLVLGSVASSQLYQAAILDNFPSFYTTTAETSSSSIQEQQRQQKLRQHQEWLKTTQMQAAAVGVHFALAGLTANRIRLPSVLVKSPKNHHHHHHLGAGGTFGVELSNTVVAARSVIIATGAVEERLHLPREDELWAKSVHSCAICDGNLYVDKTVVVVGGGDAAVEAVLLLSRYATKVYMVHRRAEFRASDQANLQTLQNLANVEMFTPFAVQSYDVSINGELEGVVVQHAATKVTEKIACNGVFVMIGSMPNTNFIKDMTPPLLKLDAEGYLVVSNSGGGVTKMTTTATSVPGIFAAGQVVDKTYRQAITAAASGAQAAIDAERWLRLQHSYSSASSSFGAKASQQRQERHLPVVPLQTIEAKDINKPQQQPEPKESLQQQHAHDCDLTREDCIREIVSKYVTVVFSKPYCPYCKKALAALELEGIKAGGGDSDLLHVIDLTSRGIDGVAVQATLQKMTGRRTVPNVFVGGKSIGGGDETSQLHASGELRKLLDAAKTLLQKERSVLHSTAVESQGNTGDDCDLTQESCITAVVNKHPVVVFSKPHCPYCRKAMAALEVEGIAADSPCLHVIDLTKRKDGGNGVQATLQKMTGRRTVPNVFVGGKSIGGGDETSQLHRDGKLKPLLQAALASFAVTN